MTVDHVAHLRTEGRALIAAFESAPTAAVAACPGWDLTALAGHVGFVWSLAAHTVATRPSSFEMPGEGSQAPEGASVADTATWLRERLDTLTTALGAAGTDTPMWTWADPQVSGFFHRRMAMETAVHRVDAQLAARGTADPVARELAVDGIDELTEVGWRSSLTRQIPDAPSGSIHLHCTDGDGEWLIRTDGAGIVVTHEHAKGDAAVRGAASDLFLYLWGRATAAPVDVIGDADVAAAWAALAP